MFLVLQYLCRIKLSRLIKFLSFTFLLTIFYVSVKVFHNEKSQNIILWWTPFMPNHDRLIKCEPGGYTCLISSKREYLNDNKLGALMFYGSKILNYDFPLPRNEQIPWAIFHEESPKNYGPILFKETQDLFNITSTFSQNSDFPITLQYFGNLSLLTDKKYFISLKDKNLFLKQHSPVLYIQSDCDTPIGRDYFVEELSKYIQVDSYGKCMKNKEFPTGLSELYPLDVYNEEFMKFIAQYKFIISIENAVCEDYVTEKFWRPLIVGSIPIYLGATNIKDWMPNQNSAILVTNFKDVQSLAEFIKYVNQNDILYNSFLVHKTLERIENNLLKSQILTDHPITDFECYVCKQMQERRNNYKIQNRNIYKCPKPNPKNKKNTWDQHWDIGRCQSKALTLLINKNVSYTEENFEETWKYLYYNKKCS